MYIFISISMLIISFLYIIIYSIKKEKGQQKEVKYRVIFGALLILFTILLRVLK